MQIGVIITNDGEHSPEKMATACAGQIMEINPSNMDGPRLLAAQKLEVAIIEALIPHHVTARDQVREEIKTDPVAHFTKRGLHDPGQHLEHAIAAVQQAAAGTPWEQEFKNPENVDKVLRPRIGQFLVDMAHLERLYHSDRNPNDELAAAYKESPTGILNLGLTATEA